MKYLRMGDLVRKTGWSPAHLRRLAHKGEIPGAKIRKGKKMKFERCADLVQWVDKMKRHETKKDRKARLKIERAARIAGASYKGDNLKPTGTGYSAIIDAERWARSHAKELSNYTPERANAVLSDITHLSALIVDLCAISKRATLGADDL